MKLFGLLAKPVTALIAILFLAVALRLAQLDKYPVGFTPDEASFGYDAYSLLTTGKDQWGEPFPISFRSFGDFKLPVYTYLTIPTVAVFGLNEFAVRLPNAIAGTLAVYAVYLMTLVMFKDRKIALFSALLLAISPWHLALSRGAFEANLTVLFMSLGVWTFYKGLTSAKWMALSALFFGINIFTYHSARLVTPLIFLLLILWNSKITSFIKKNWVAIVIFGVFLALAFATIISGSGARAADITIFNPTDKWMSVFDERYGAVFGGLPYNIAVIFHNKYFGVIQKFIETYSTYLSPQFLFTQGAGEWTYGMISGRGVLYLFEIPFILVSLWFLIKNGFSGNKSLSLIVFWILVSIIPAALTKGPGYAGNRAAVMMPAIQIFSAFGGIYLFNIVKKQIGRTMTILAYIFIIFLSLVFFLEAYRFIAPRKGADGMLYGRREAMEFISESKTDYKTVIISRTLSEPQIYAAFYLKIDPEFYQAESGDWMKYKEMGVPFVDQLGEYRLGKYVFKNVDYMNDSKIPDVLIIGKPIEFPERIIPTKTILYPNQLPALFIVDPATVSFTQ
jgi:4-amino-4-deoxy-L-arabinose transferase-like glycosyltransferase